MQSGVVIIHLIEGEDIRLAERISVMKEIR